MKTAREVGATNKTKKVCPCDLSFATQAQRKNYLRRARYEKKHGTLKMINAPLYNQTVAHEHKKQIL